MKHHNVQPALDGDARDCLTWLRGHVAALLELPAAQVSETEDLMDQGLDSVRLMTLVERLRADGADVDFVDLTEHFTLVEWANVVNRPVAAAARLEAES